MEKIENLQDIPVSEVIENDSLFTINPCFSITIDKNLRETFLENIRELNAYFRKEPKEDKLEELGEIINIEFNETLNEIINEITEEYEESGE